MWFSLVLEGFFTIFGYFVHSIQFAWYLVVNAQVALLSLMQLVFSREANDRSIPFAEIAAQSRLPVDQVRSSSLGCLPYLLLDLSAPPQLDAGVYFVGLLTFLFLTFGLILWSGGVAPHALLLFGVGEGQHG
jgi:hypothetical protein